MIPSEDNFFDGIKYPKVMIDSGCASLSLPYPSQILFKDFYEKYKNYIWTIGKSSGVGLHHKIHLAITGDSPNSFEIRLGCSPKLIRTKTLKFILTYEIILQILDKGIFNKPGCEIFLKKLQDYKEFVLKNSVNILELIEKPKKELVLLGQQILKKFFILQLNFVMIAVKKTPLQEISFRISIIEQEYVSKHMDFEKDHKELYDCLDEEHDETQLFPNLEDDY